MTAYGRSIRATVVPLIGCAILLSLGQATLAQQEQPFRVEYYYKVKWGHFNEFMELYKRNHYPILERLQRMGVILDMEADSPFYHAGEDSRWDFRFTIVWKNASVAHERADRSALIAELYPDREKFQKEEQRRFEILEEHQDVPIVRHDLSGW